MKIETRYLTVSDLEVRERRDGGRELRGYAIKFNEWSQDLGGFVERCDPACVTRTLASGADVRHLINHDPNLVLGRTAAGTTRLEADQVGVMTVTDLPDTTYARDLAVSVERGDINQMSFGFRVAKGGDEWDWDATPAERTLRDIDLVDVSTVTFPAYPQTTSEVRSLLAEHGIRGALPANEGLPVAPSDTTWDGDKAAQAVEAWADGDAAKLKKAFLYVEDGADATKIGSYKLGYADIIDGKLTIVPAAVNAIASVLGGGRGGLKGVSDEDLEALKASLAELKGHVNAAEQKSAPNGERRDGAAQDAVDLDYDKLAALRVMIDSMQSTLEGMDALLMEFDPTRDPDTAPGGVDDRSVRVGKAISAENAGHVSAAADGVTAAMAQIQAVLPHLQALADASDMSSGDPSEDQPLEGGGELTENSDESYDLRAHIAAAANHSRPGTIGDRLRRR